MINKQNFEITKSLLRANPNRIDMNHYSTGVITMDKVDGKLATSYNACGTVGCIAGHIEAYVNGVITDETEFNNVLNNSQEFLGLTEDQALKLFMPHKWPDSYYFALDRTVAKKDYVEVICDRMDYMMETGR